MELTADFIAIQGILSNVVKSTGDFTKMNYRGGNEEKLMQIMHEIQKYLVSKCYIKDDKVNEIFDKQLEDIVLFLAINTVFKHKVEFEEYAHLLNIIPPLSKCVLANVVYGLKLCKYYCTVIEKLPLEVSTELLDEMLPCLKKTIPNLQLEYSQMFLMAAAKKLEAVDYSSKTEDDIDNITEVTNTILRNLTGIYSDQTKNMNCMKIYQHMGHCLLTLFELLLYCNKNCITQEKFVKNLLRTCCSIIQNVTLNVFCAWAELEFDDEVFQTIISEKAYNIIENYQKHPEAAELISMLGTIARKPLSFSQMIKKSDTATIIKKVNKCDSNQKNWFRALLTNQVFKDTEAVDCIKKWSQLCTDEDVTLLINQAIETKDKTANKLVIKCACSLNLEQLNRVMTRHFYRNKFSHIFEENIEQNLMLIFNKLNENSQSKPDLTLELSLLLLQNPPIFYKFIYRECFKNTYYTDCLKDMFLNIKEISEIDDIGIKSFNEVLYEDNMNQQKANNISYLCKLLLDVDYFKGDSILSKILFPFLKKYSSEKQLEELMFGLQILLESNLMIHVENDNYLFLELCLEVMKENRCKFLNFVNINQDIVKCIVEIFLDRCEINDSEPIPAFETTDDDLFTNYYKNYLCASTTLSFFKSVCPEFDISHEGNCVSQLLQVLPSAVYKEWMMVCDEMQKEYGVEKCIEILTDMMILLSQLVETQDIEKNKFVYAGLKYCICNFGLIIQNIQKDPNLDTEIIVTRQVCRLISKLPTAIKETEGLTMTNLLTKGSLKTLGKDKEFLCHLILIKNTTICRILAERIKEQ